MRLSNVDSRLHEVIVEASKWMDIAVICGHRDEEAQGAAFSGGFSKKAWPDSKHNRQPSQAVDVVPYDNGIDWNNIEAFQDMVLLIKIIAQSKGIKIRCGADFISFKDYPHIELM